MAKTASEVPAQPAKPPYIEAFECFTVGQGDQIEAFVAFGLFVASDYTWAKSQTPWPAEGTIKEAYRRLLHEIEVQKTRDKAKSIVESHRENLVREHERKYLEAMFKEIETRVDEIAEKASRRHFLRGVLEATLGAVFWTLICISVAAIVSRAGIDVLHVITGH